MLKMLGGGKRLCDGSTRRELLIAGGLGISGSLAQWSSPVANFENRAVANTRSGLQQGGFGSAKNVILLYLFGGSSHLETFDPKPAAPMEIRGEFSSVETSIAGVRICEHLPRTASLLDRCTVIRSMTHPWNFHGMQYATTGLAVGSVPVEENVIHSDHQPFLGSVLSYYRQRVNGPKSPGAIPDNIYMPFPLSSRRVANYLYAKPYSAYLGSAYDPIVTEFRGTATRSMLRRSFGPPAEVMDPFLGVSKDSRFLIVPEAELPAELNLDRLDRRRALLEQLESHRRKYDTYAARDGVDHKRDLAFSLLDSQSVRQAFDLNQEPASVKESYGQTLFGQSTLQARRLVEAGCRFVTVVWDEYGQLNSGWDTHVDHFNRLKNELLPGFDSAYSSLLTDLENRGLLDETLVVVTTEMGRTPRLESGDGRGHWGRAYSNLLAGAGVKRGSVLGHTDAIGAQVADSPTSAKDILATVYHLAGVDPDATLPDRLNRPIPLAHDGRVLTEILS
jgi:hypothetical protein